MSSTVKLTLTSKSLKYIFFLSLVSALPNVADDVTVGELSARLEELENKIEGRGGKTDDHNPGAQVTPEDLERLQEEIRNLRADVQSLQRENAALRLQESSRRVIPFSEEAGAQPQSRTKTELSSKTAYNKTSLKGSDSETESILQILEQSAPSDEPGEENFSRNKNNKELEEIRNAATRHAEEAASEKLLPLGNAEAQYNQAITLHDKGAYKEAENAFGYFITTYPTDPLVFKAIYWKGESCLKQGKYKEAKILFVTAYKKNPKGPKAADCLLKLGETLAMQGRTEDACTTWKKLKTDFPHITAEMKGELTSLKKRYGCTQLDSMSTPKS